MNINKFFFFAFLFVSTHCIAMPVYTIGAYDDAFNRGVEVTKLGPLAVSDVPPTLPPSFLEEDGSYGGGEAFSTIKQACYALEEQLKANKLPMNENWHIYLLDADWDKDVYQLHSQDYRIKRAVKVLKPAANCY